MTSLFWSLRSGLTGLVLAGVLSSGALAGREKAYSEAEVNKIIKSLTPIKGQKVQPGYCADRKKCSKVIIDDDEIIIDYTYNIDDIEVYFPFDSERLTLNARARINRNLRLVIRGLGMDGRIGFRGNRFEIDKIAAPVIR